MPHETFNVGIIGYGLSAKIFHIPFVEACSYFRLHAIVQRRPTPANDAAKDHPQAKVYQSTEELNSDTDVNLIIITTAPESHFELAKAAIIAKKNVLVEKPFTPTSTEAAELTALASQHGVILTVYQNRRWDADFVTLSRHVKDGTLGRVVEFESHFDRHRPEIANLDSWKYKPQPGTGVIYDLGSHLIDQAVHLFGMPKSITAFLYSQREHNPTGMQDSCTVLLHYDGLLVTIKAAVVSPEVNQLRYWVRGVQGSFMKFHLDCQEDQLHQGMRPRDHGYGVEPEERHGRLNTVEDGKVVQKTAPTLEPPTYLEFYNRLGKALASGDPKDVPVTGEEATNVIRLIELAQQSSREGRTIHL